jgi:uncharacterized membrane-anchored protein YitT (DUF2179 family)
VVLSAPNLPIYLLAIHPLGWPFPIKTFLAVGLLSIYTELLPALISLQTLNPVFAALMGGCLVGVGLLMLIRHRASLGGIGVVAIHLQNSRGWRAGAIQGVVDVLIVAAAIFIRDPWSIVLSIFGALALNLVIAVNHKTGRYVGL